MMSNKDDVPTSVKRARASRIAAAEAQGWTGPWRFGNTHLHGTPPSGKRSCHDGDHVPDAVDKLIVRLHSQIDDLTAGVEAVRELMNESNGVAGLHRNGEVAAWASLEEGGRFEEWLIAFNHAERVADEQAS